MNRSPASVSYPLWALCLLALSLTGPPSAAAAEAEVAVEGMRIGLEAERARVVFDLSTGAEYEIFKLEAPERVVIDLRRAVLQADLSGLDLQGSPVGAVRSGQRENGALRVVLDLSTPVEPSSFFLRAEDGRKDRLVVDLRYLDPEWQKAEAREEETRRDIRVAVAAGHGGNDPGALSHDGTIREKDITLAVARAIRDRLNATPGYQPVMIRDDDVTVKLKERPGIGRASRADVYLSIHADSYEGRAAQGATVYALSGDTADRENARRIAERENLADVLGEAARDVEDDIALTLLDLAMTSNIEQSVKAGGNILDSLGVVAPLRRSKVQAGDLWELRSHIPSLLIETGYLSNPQEAARLATPAYQRHLANAIVRGVMDYFNGAPPEGTLVAWQQENGIEPGSYVVADGDSLSVIAQDYGTRVAELKQLNGLQSDLIRIGQALVIPGSGLTPIVSEHTIRPGDTLSEIAEHYQVSLNALRRINGLNNDHILAGKVLQIPAD